VTISSHHKTTNAVRTDTRKVKQRLLERDNFTREQAEDLVEAFFEDDDPVVTRSVLRDELRRFTLRIVLANAAVMAALLALFAFELMRLA
jgi:hypothetical protein